MKRYMLGTRDFRGGDLDEIDLALRRSGTGAGLTLDDTAKLILLELVSVFREQAETLEEQAEAQVQAESDTAEVERLNVELGAAEAEITAKDSAINSAVDAMHALCDALGWSAEPIAEHEKMRQALCDQPGLAALAARVPELEARIEVLEAQNLALLLG